MYSKSNPLKISFILALILMASVFAVTSSFAQATGDYRSAATGNWNTLSTWQRYDGSSWLTPTAAQGTPVNASGVITIRNGHNVSVTAFINPDEVVVDAGGTLTINAGVIFRIRNGAGTDLNVSGTLAVNGTLEFRNNTSIVCNSGSILVNRGTVTPPASGGSFTMGSGSTFQHNQNGGTIPALTWNAASTLLVTGITSTVPAGLNQSFGHVTWNCTGQSANLSLAANLATVNGNLTITSTGSPTVRALQLSTTTNHSLSVSGTYIQTGGNLTIQATSGTGNLNIAGGFSMTGGTLAAGSGTANLNFNGTSSQAFSKTGGTISGVVRFAVNNGAIVDFNNQVLDGASATFNLAAGGKIITSHPEGLSSSGATGTIQVGGSRTYSNTASYEFRGSNTGSFTTTSSQVANLTFNRSSGITSDRSFTVTGILNLASGIVTTGTNTITVGSAGSVTNASSSNYINGKLALTYSAAGSKTFPVGKGGVYRPVSLQYLSLTGTSVVTTEQFESSLTGTLPANTNLYGSRYWNISQTGGSAFTYKVTFDATGYTPSGNVVIVKKDGVSITSHNTTAPNYTNNTSFTTLASSFAIGSDCSASTVANAGPDQTDAATCGKTSVTLAANTPAFGTGSWSVVSGTGGSFLNAANPSTTFTGTNGTAYVLRWTVTNGNCTAQDDVNITLNQLPVAGITNNTGTTQLTCAVTSISLTATGGATYAWDNGLGSGASKSITSPGSYQVTVTGSNGCSSHAGISISQDITPPTAGITNNTGTTQLTCATTSISLMATGGGSYSWDNGLGNSSTINIIDPGTYSLTVTAANGCTDQESISITQDITSPTAGITNNSGTTELTCSQTSISVTATGGVSYSWDNGLGNSAGASISSPGTYTVTVTGSNGCSSQTSITITQDISTPSAGISNNSGTSELTCTQASISVTATGGVSYSWDNGLGINAGANISAPGTYTVTVTGSNGCSSQASITITQDISTPTAGITNNSGTTELNCVQTSIPVTATGGSAYSWDNAMGTDPSILITTPGTYTVTVTGSNGCSNQANINITQNITPPANPGAINGTTDVCPFTGTNTVLTYSVSPVAGAVSYLWTVPAGVQIQSGQGTTSLDVKVTNQFPFAASFVFTAMAANGCTSSTSLDVIKDVPAIPTAINGPTNVCEYIGSGAAVYSIDPVAKATFYTWSVSGTGMSIISGQGTTSIQVGFTGVFVRGSVKVVANSNCGSRAPRSMSISRRLPSAPSTITGPVDVCAYVGTNTLITYSLTGGANASSYEWLLPADVNLVSGQGTNSIVVTFGSQFVTSMIQVRSVNACGASGYRKLKVTRLRPSTPSIFEISEISSCPNRQYRYSIIALPANASSVQWTVPAGATLTSGQGTTSITVSYPSGAITGLVSAVGVNDCNTGSPRSSTIKLSACPSPLGKGDQGIPVTIVPVAVAPVEAPVTKGTKPVLTTDEWSFQVFPNPTSDVFKIHLNSNSKEQVQVRIIHFDGRELKRISMMPDALRSLGSELAPGTYFIEVSQGDKRSVQKLIKL